MPQTSKSGEWAFHSDVQEPFSFKTEDVKKVRLLLSKQPPKPLTQQQLSDLLSCAWSTIARIEGGHKPSSDIARIIVALRDALTEIGDMLKPEDRAKFFITGHPMLLNLRPIDLLPIRGGKPLIINLLRSAASGSFG